MRNNHASKSPNSVGRAYGRAETMTSAERLRKQSMFDQTCANGIGIGLLNASPMQPNIPLNVSANALISAQQAKTQHAM